MKQAENERIRTDPLGTFLNVCVSIYVTIILVLPIIVQIKQTNWILMVFFAIGVFASNIYLLNLRRVCDRKKDACVLDFSIKRFLFFAIVILANMMVVFLGYFPGGVTPDTVDQWRQIQTGVFSDWHPFAHTLILLILAKALNQFWCVVAVQIMAFSFAAAYFSETAYRFGLPKWALVSAYFVFLLNRTGRVIMLYLWKDGMLTIFVLLIMAQLISIVGTKGGWLDARRNRIAFSVLMGYATLLRHNAFFFTIPILMLVFIIYKGLRRKIVRCSALVLCVVIFVKLPLSMAFSVTTNKDQVFGESIGLPMTILTDAYMSTPEALPEEIRNIFDNLMRSDGSEYNWNESYVGGVYNSVKFYCEMVTPLKSMGITGIIKGAMRTALAEPYVAITAAAELTDMVWTISGEAEGVVRSAVRTDWESPIAPLPQRNLFTTVDEKLESHLRKNPFGSLFEMIGLYTLLLVVATLYGYHRNGMGTLVLTIPTICYNLGTMLLLMGNDYRFFHFSTVIGFAVSVFVVVPWKTMENTSKSCIVPDCLKQKT